MRIINIIDRFDAVNFGIWNAACFTASQLVIRHNMQSELWFPQHSELPENPADCLLRPLSNLSKQGLLATIAQAGINCKNSVIITHGCWRFPSRWGAWLKQMGYRWVYVPHGMLEPWSRSQHAIRKWVYWHIVERSISHRADRVRAVGEPEYNRLKAEFAKCVWVPNGISSGLEITKTVASKRVVLFMARLHHKKNIMPLVEAWAKSQLMQNINYELQIAGPDDGQLAPLLNFLSKQASNIKYLSAQYGADKEQTLRAASFFVLPSQSEGFPTSVLEAMQYGLIPLISEGCNFPSLLNSQLAIDTGQSPETILAALNKCVDINTEEWLKWSLKLQAHANQHYTDIIIADQMAALYLQLLKNNTDEQ